jgi:methionine synthase II (cobalamin-independent)
MEITKDISIEELVEALPSAVGYLSRAGIRCIRCGEPIWGTLEKAAREKGFSDADIERFVAGLRELYENPPRPSAGK